MRIKYFLAAVSFFSVVEGSFRSMEEHGASFEHAKTHSGYGPAVLVISQIGDNFSISNGVYVAPGKVLTHSHEDRQPNKTWVASPFAGFTRLEKNISLNIDDDNFIISSSNIVMRTIESHKACKKVKNIDFPATRVETRPSVRAMMLDLKNPAFLEEDFLDRAARGPIGLMGKEGFAIEGDDYCILSIDPFPKHPVARLANGVDENETITILGHSLGTHIHDGTDSIFCNTLSDVAMDMKRQGMRCAAVPIQWQIQMTTFSQVAQRKDNKFVVQAISAKQNPGLHEIYDKETWDIKKTPSDIQALIVNGLSGSGVYNTRGELVALVSCSFQSFETDHFFREEDSLKADLTKALSDAKNGVSDAEKEAAKERAREIVNTLKINHPVLNIHQIITAEMLAL